MIALSILRIVLHLLRGLLTCALVFPLVDADGRARRIRNWSVDLLAIFRLTVVVRHTGSGALAPRALIVANHVSWLDIFVINAMQPCRFVAKSDIRSWPLLGYLCARSGTIFIARGRVRDVRRIFQDLVDSIRNGEHVAFFPEGTTSAQGSLLPFHANLFEAAIDAGVSIQPMALRYLDASGALAPHADFIGEMTFAESMMVILKAPRLTAELIVLPLIDSTGAHRRELAPAARTAIAEALGYEH
ncbi:lysophospholipid acyltransferase family protein [Actimicrobium sp. CCI2.3]|uniref:lysophospholipid acyltransferase family protein n=1 Tax=Actimicrobium sp. CCI2.3 TaxID=3048616 RepID=UPI002AB519AC|nr:lysophospholipid acyltransferase family protein [Actimicrobium sp. CCI2.3]MDY7573677.1 lysophospholipid acyltransferase family protein [Actimicrobium sp. CCI2.3]MEB0021051.1 lysophospholipid acyltransferase family protein [Actimicrobium sp. CCI2.3]